MNAEKRKLPSVLSQKEIDILVKSIRKDRHRLGVALMGYAGLRVSEMTSLKVCDVYLAREYIMIKGKGGKYRIVPLSDKLRIEIENYLNKYSKKLNPDSVLVGGNRSSWHIAVTKYAKRILGRSDVHCHTLRHSFATALYENNVPIERISELLGHAKLDTTMIYSRISLSQKKDAVRVFDTSISRFTRFFPRLKRRHDLSVTSHEGLIGRDKELQQLQDYINKKVSCIVVGPQGCGKSAVLKAIPNSVYIQEFKKKQTLIFIILSSQDLSPEAFKEAEKELKKLSVDELISQLKDFEKVIVFDDVSNFSKQDKNTISKLSQVTTVLAASSKPQDKKLFNTFLDIKPLKRYYTRQILYEMIVCNDTHKKERIVDDILHQSGDNLKEAEYIARQLQLGKTGEEITTEEREANQVSIAPVLLIFVLFFFAYILKSYATSMVAFSYAMLVVFRLIFYRYLFYPSTKKK
jgi:hypothetical protein